MVYIGKYKVTSGSIRLTSGSSYLHLEVYNYIWKYTRQKVILSPMIEMLFHHLEVYGLYLEVYGLYLEVYGLYLKSSICYALPL